MFYETILWLVIFIITTIASILGLIYLVTRFNKFHFLDKIAKEHHRLRKSLPVTLVLGLIIASYIIFGYVNAIVIVISLAIFWLIADGLMAIIKLFKINVYTDKVYYNGLIAITFTIIYLGIGWYLDHNVTATYYTVTTPKSVSPLRIVQISDSHLGTTFDGKGFTEELSKIQSENPDIVLITGDYVDGSSNYQDIIDASSGLGKLNTTYGVYFCYGNHDRNFYNHHQEYTEAQLVDELVKNGVVILQDECVVLPGGYTIIGREDADINSRIPIAELVQGIDKNSFIIDMNHQPSDYNNEEAANVDMVLSGHTHGGQLIPINNVGVWIGAVDKIYGQEQRSNTNFIVTSGISDWALDFKTGCHSEYVVIDIVSQSE